MNNHNLIAIDLAKNIFQVCIVNSNNRVLMNKSFNRASLNEFIVKQEPTLIVMEACYSSHYWGGYLNRQVIRSCYYLHNM